MFVHNTTFMILRERETEFIQWISARIPKITERLHYAESPRLSILEEAGGADHLESEAQSIAFQIGFDSLDAAREYADKVMAETIVAFEKAFGPEAIAFTSIFRSIPV